MAESSDRDAEQSEALHTESSGNPGSHAPSATADVHAPPADAPTATGSADTAHPATPDQAGGDAVTQAPPPPTHNRRASDAWLRTSAGALYRAIVEQSDEGIWVVDSNGRTAFANARVAEILGVPLEHILERPPREMLTAEALPLINRFRTRWEAGLPDQGEVRFAKPDGTDVWAHVSSTPLSDDQGNPSGAVALITDVTERHRVEHERRALLARLSDAAEAERSRLAEALHDGPVQQLAAVNLRIANVERDVTDPRARARLEVLRDALGDLTDGLRNLMFDLLPPDLARLGLVRTIESAADRNVAGTAMRAMTRGHLATEPAQRVAVTAYRIAQEAVSNAVKHSSGTRIDVSIAEADEGLAIVVRDDGEGVDALSLAHTGPSHLGVRGMRERAAAIGGWCRIDGGPQGTTVAFWLPLALPGGEPAEPDAG